MLPNWLYGKSKSKLQEILGGGGAPADYDQVKAQVTQNTEDIELLSDTLDEKAAKSDLASISITGDVNNSGSTIAIGTYFYKAGSLVRAILDIPNEAALTLNTNYEAVANGALNDAKVQIIEGTLGSTADTWSVIFALPPGYTKTNTYIFQCNVYWAGVTMWYLRDDVLLRINNNNEVEASTSNQNNLSCPCKIAFVKI